ncbi:hypothetical protein [Leisingera daeponensis]|nr:hypothetical protein [Leisingera daeponensis]
MRVLCIATVAAAAVAIAHMSLSMALALPEITAEAQERSAW